MPFDGSDMPSGALGIAESLDPRDPCPRWTEQDTTGVAPGAERRVDKKDGGMWG